jgi:hypothetical protein
MARDVEPRLLSSLRKCRLNSGNRLKQSCLLIRARSVGNKSQQPPGIVNGFFNQPHVALADRFQLPHDIPEKGSLSSYFQGKRLFETVGKFHKSKLLSRNPERPAQIVAEACHLRLQSAELDVERLFDFIAFQDSFHAALYQQSCFAPRVLNEIAVKIDLIANDSQELRNSIF